MKSVCEALADVVKVSETYCWSDSQIVLWWIKQINKNWKVWINNRVNIIRKNIPPAKWFYVLTIENPADIATRISNPLSLVNNLLWWRGPQFINSDNVQIPNQDVFNIVEKSKSDIYETVKMDNVVEKVVGVGETIDCEKYSSLEKLLRVTCFIRRFILNLKAKVRGEKLLEGGLLTLEIENS